MKLMVILGSSRQGRRGETVAKWVNRVIEQDDRFELDYVDTKTLGLPFFDEPISPLSLESVDDYKTPGAKEWAQRVGAADAYLLVTPEYNHGYPGVLKNTLDWVGREWDGKPVGFVSYSWPVTGGARAVEQLRQVVIELGMTPGSIGLHIGAVQEAFDEHGNPKNEYFDKTLKRVLDEVAQKARPRS